MPRFHKREDRLKLPEAERVAEEQAIKQCLGSHQFQKGTSGNPLGRPRTPENAKLLLKDNAYAVVERLLEVASDPSNKHYYDAVCQVIDRVYGKAVQPLDVDQNNSVQICFDNGLDDLAK